MEQTQQKIYCIKSKKKEGLLMKEIAENSYFRAVDTKKADTIRGTKKRKLFVRPKERPIREEIIENSIKYSRLEKQ